ncbi:MAG: hypothetical protein MZV65_52330 [Chromatiales bacterium]|nr:hypothetical protein [Chromatiales bacterium]
MGIWQRCRRTPRTARTSGLRSHRSQAAARRLRRSCARPWQSTPYDLTPVFPQLDQFEFHHRLTRTTGVAIVLFTSRGCASGCKAMEEAARRLPPQAHARPRCSRNSTPSAIWRWRARFNVFHLPALFTVRRRALPLRGAGGGEDGVARGRDRRRAGRAGARTTLAVR